MHISQWIPLLLAIVVLGVAFWYANGSDIIQPWKSVLLVVLVIVMVVVLLSFAGIHVT